MPAEFDIAAALRESEEMLKNIGAKPAPETSEEQPQAESDPGLLNKDWGWQAGLESALGIEQKPTTVAAALNEVGFGNLNEQQKAIADSVEDPEEISKFPAWHEKTPRQKEIAYEYSKRPITMSDVGAGVKGALAGFGGLSESLLKGVGKIARDFTPDPEIYSATPERAKELSAEQGKRQLNALRSFSEAWTDLGQEVGHLYHKGTTTGFSNVDRIYSSLGMSEERRREKWMARDALEMENARKALANPSSLGTFSKETLKAVLSFNGPSVEEILYLHPEFKGDIEKAKAFKEKQVEDRASEALSGYLQWLKDVPADPDIKSVAALTPLPGVGAANLWSLGEKTLKGALELGSVTRRLASGMTAEQWAASQAAKGREALAKSAEAASKMGPVGRGAERVANIIDDSGQKILTGLGNIPGAKTLGEALERTSEFLEEAGVPQQLQQGAKSLGGKVVTGATIGSFLDEDTVKGAALGAGLGAVALGAPRFVADLSRASARNAKGITGTFGALAQDPTRGWMSRLATVRPEAVDWIAGHMADFTKSGVHATPMAITLGLMDSDDPQGFVKSMMEGWAWAAGPQLIHKALGKDPVQMQRERSKYDHQVYKLKSSMSPEDVQRLDVFANIDAEIAAAQKYVDKTTQAYQQALSEQGESETPSEKVQYFQALANKANIRLEAAKKNAADPAAREEFARQFWYRIADIDAHISGSIEPGKNVKVELLTTSEMLDKLGEANRKTMSELGGPLPTIPMSAWGPEEINTLSPEQRAYYQRLMFISEAEGASYIRKNTVRKSNGQRVDKNTGEHVIWDPKMEKGTVALNSDVIIKNMIEDGNAFLSVYAHEIGHQLENFDEHKKRTAGLREKLFGTERKDAQGNVIAKTDGIFSDDHLVDLFMQKYGRSNVNLTPEEVAENLGLFNRSTGEYDIPGIVSVMRDEVLADFNAVGLYRNYFFNQPKGVAGMVNWLTLKDQNSRVKKLARKLAGLRDEGSAFGERSGAEFTPEAQRLIEQHMRELKSLRGNMAPHNPEESYTPPVAKKDLVANKELSDYYLTDSGRFKTEMAGVVYDADGKVVAEVVLQDPDAKEGAWFHHIDENGRNQISQASGDGEMPPELADLSIPVGGHLMSLVRLARDPSGKPIENSNKETREVVERRSQAIRDAIDNSGDVGAPDRLRPVAPGSNTYRGTLTDAQIEAIRRLPNRVVPYSIKKKLYDVNNALKKGDGTRLLLDYATRIDARGRYVPFSPKIQDVVPIGMMFSSDGHFLVTTVSISRMMSKLDRWEAFMPLRLKPWGGSKGSFMEEFVGSYLENHQNGFPGSGFDPATGEVVPGAKPLARDAAEAETKRNIFNDFLNMYDSNTIESNPDRTELPKLKLTREQREDERLVKLTKEQRKAEKSSDQNTMVRSLRLDSIMDLVESDLKKIPVDYYKAKHNLSLDVYEQSRAPRQQQLPAEPESDLLRGMRLNMTQAPGGPKFSLLRSDRGQEEAMVERGFYSQMGRTLLNKVPSRATLTQVKNILTGQGIKADEIKWSGIMPYLEMIEKRDGVVTRRDIELFLSDNYKARFVQQEDRVRLPESMWLLTGSGIHESYSTEAEALNAMEDAINEHVEFLQKNESYEVDQTDDGRFFVRDSLGRSLREYFDTYQEAEDSITAIFRKEAEREFEVSVDEDAEVEGGEYFNWRTKNDNMYAETYREVVLGHPDVNYTSRHFPAYENYVAHMRLQDGVDSKGRLGTLVEELQSDLHSDAREKGYDTMPNTEGWKAQQVDVGPFREGEKIFYNVSSSNGRNLGSVETTGPEEAIRLVAEMHKEGPPSAPFKNDWPLFLFKRALLDAVDSNKKWIGWPDAAEQIERYPGLERNFYKIIASKKNDKYKIEAFSKTARAPLTYFFTESQLPNAVGRELSQKIINDHKKVEDYDISNGTLRLMHIGGRPVGGFYEFVAPDGRVVQDYISLPYGVSKEAREAELRDMFQRSKNYAYPEETVETSYEGIDLKMGGGGMRHFYDEILPKTLGKYVKQWGGTVEKRRFRPFEPKSQYWHIDITPEMAEGVRRGQALFSLKNTGEAGPRESIDKTQDDNIRRLTERPEDRSVLRGTNTGGAAPSAGDTGPYSEGLKNATSRASENFRAVFEEEARFNPAGAQRAAEEAAILDYAEKTGTTRDAYDFFRRWREDGAKGGNEHQIIVGDGGSFVEKRTNMPYFHESWSEYIDRVKLHNTFFPEAPITIVGAQNQPRQLGTPHGDIMPAGLYLVTEQPYIKWQREATDTEIADYLGKKGFEKVEPAPGEKDLFEWKSTDGRVRLIDVRGDNIVMAPDANGKLAPVVIDVPIRIEQSQKAGALEGVQFSLNAGKSITTEEEMRKLDSLANKKAKQVDADTLPYPVNPNVDSVTLPPRYGLVNANIVGMPRSFKDVHTLLNNLTTRLTNVAYRDPQFALEAASFYSDMADSALKLADAVQPGVSGMEKWLSAELNMRYLALGSPKSAVAANATKSASSVAGTASDFAGGFKIGMGEQAIGAATTQKAWKRGEHFDLSLPGVQDKVRSFYLNGLAELIELAQKEGNAAAVKELMLRAGKSLRVFDPAQTELSDADIAEVQRLLDGKATVDMWDMAAKGEAWPGYLIFVSERQKKTEPFQWTQDKFEKKSNLGTPQWQKVLKELKIAGPENLRYQQARALKIDGNAAWDEVSWEARKQQPFPATTQFSYYTKASEAGLSPGGGGPLYDAQQAIDGMLADRINEMGLAHLFGKEKLKARNAQEILWALEKLDNPIKRNNDLSLFKASFDPFMDEIMALRGVPTAARSHLGRNVLGAMERTYGEMARQVMPLEVVSSGTSVEAKRIQQKIADLQAAGDTNAAKTLTDWVADGLHDVINTFAAKHGLKVTADRVAVGEGGYTEAAQLNIAPNMRIVLRGDPAQTYQVLEALSRALDQDGGNIIRKPTIRELNDVQKIKNKVLTFDTTQLSQADRNNFFLEAAKLLDANGNPFLTGFTETEAGLAIGNQFYSGDFEAAIAMNQQQLQALRAKYNIPKMFLEEAIIDTFYRGQDPSKTTTSQFAKAIYGHIANKLSTTPQAASFPQAVDFETLWRNRADSLRAAIEQYPIRTKPQIKKAKANAPEIASATKQTAAHTELKSQLLAAVLRDEISKERYKELMVEYGYAKPGKEGESDESDE